MTHKTLVIDLDRCIGCFACEMACKQENNVPLGVHYNKVLSIGPMGKFPDLTQYFLPTVCQHCKDAPCVKVCPTGATYQTEDGKHWFVWYDDSRSVGEKVRLAKLFGVTSVSLWRLGNLPADSTDGLYYNVLSACQ